MPDEWFGEPLEKWHTLQVKYGTEWDLSLEYVKEHADILLTGIRRNRTGDDVRQEIVHSPDFGNINKVCQKIDAFEIKIQEAMKRKTHP